MSHPLIIRLEAEADRTVQFAPATAAGVRCRAADEECGA